MTNRALPIVAGALLVGGTAALVWHATPIQRAALAVGDWCSAKEHSVLCGALAGVAANLVTMELGKGKVLLAPVAKMCSANPQSCLWLGSVISFVAIDSNSKSDTIIFSDNLLSKLPDSDIYHWEIQKFDSPKYEPPKYYGLMKYHDVSSICDGHPDICRTIAKDRLPLEWQNGLLNDTNLSSDSQLRAKYKLDWSRLPSLINQSSTK